MSYLFDPAIEYHVFTVNIDRFVPSLQYPMLTAIGVEYCLFQESFIDMVAMNTNVIYRSLSMSQFLFSVIQDRIYLPFLAINQRLKTN